MNYYNEYDPKVAAWLRELIKAGHIADGIVEELSWCRSTVTVQIRSLIDYWRRNYASILVLQRRSEIRL